MFGQRIFVGTPDDVQSLKYFLTILVLGHSYGNRSWGFVTLIAPLAWAGEGNADRIHEHLALPLPAALGKT